MSKSNTQETSYLKLIYQNIAMANIGDTSGIQPSATEGSLYVALYTSDPTDADVGIEADYTSYARVAVSRNVAGWTVSGNQVTNAAVITFPVSTGGTNTITHYGIRTALTGGDLIHYAALSSSITINDTETPKFNVGGISGTEN